MGSGWRVGSDGGAGSGSLVGAGMGGATGSSVGALFCNMLDISPIKKF